MTLTRGDFETLEIEANTGASAEVDQATTANQLNLDLDTGSTFFGGQQLRVETRSSRTRHGVNSQCLSREDGNRQGLDWGDVRVNKTATVEVEEPVTGGAVRRSSC